MQYTKLFTYSKFGYTRLDMLRLGQQANHMYIITRHAQIQNYTICEESVVVDAVNFDAHCCHMGL